MKMTARGFKALELHLTLIIFKFLGRKALKDYACNVESDHMRRLASIKINILMCYFSIYWW